VSRTSRERGAEYLDQFRSSVPLNDAQPETPGYIDVENGTTVELLCASDLRPEPVKWIWAGWLAAGKLHIIAGEAGTGKTTIAMSLGATITSGGLWPDGSRSPIGNIVIWSGEDDPADTLVPRLALSNADLSRVYFVSDVRDEGERRAFDPARDMEMLRTELMRVGGAYLLIIDPIVSAVAGDSHRNAEVRRALQPLVDLASSIECAVLGITHFSKGTGGRSPIERLNGSVAFGALARVVMVAARRQQESVDGSATRVFLRAKSNIGLDDGGFEYELREGELIDHPGVSASSTHWGAQVDGSARELLNDAETTSSVEEGGSLASAQNFLSRLLADGPIPAKTVEADAAEAGYSRSTLRRAKAKLKIVPTKVGMGGGWQWELPRRCSEKSEGVQQISMSTFEGFEHLRAKPGKKARALESIQELDEPLAPRGGATGGDEGENQ
jgi:putative DNA primase/helicase